MPGYKNTSEVVSYLSSPCEFVTQFMTFYVTKYVLWEMPFSQVDVITNVWSGIKPVTLEFC